MCGRVLVSPTFVNLPIKTRILISFWSKFGDPYALTDFVFVSVFGAYLKLKFPFCYCYGYVFNL